MKQMYGRQNVQSSGGSARIWPFVIGCVSAVLVGLAVTLLVRNFWALGVESGGSCGSSNLESYGPCPRGMGLMLPLSFIGLFAFVPLMLISRMRARPRRLGVLVLVPLMAVGALLAFPVFTVLHGPGLQTVWAAPTERPTGVDSLGSWQFGSSVQRARFDGVVAYDIGTGRRTWVHDIPAPQVLCAMSRGAEQGIGLIGHAEEHKPCTHVTAVNLADGRALWTKTVPPETASSNVEADVIAVAGQTAAIRNNEQITAYTTRAGAARWTQRAEDRCRFGELAGGTDQFIIKIICAEKQPAVRAIDAATGRTRWETALPVRGPSAGITLLSATPTVVRVTEGGQRGVDVLVAFDPAGRITAQIRVDDGDRRLATDAAGFDAAPERPIAVQDGVLVVSGRTTENDNMVYAYRLSDGRELWSVEPEEEISTMRAAGDRIVLVEDESFSARLQQVGLRTGKLSDLGMTGDAGSSSMLAAYLSGNHYVLVTESGGRRDAHPVLVLTSN